MMAHGNWIVAFFAFLPAFLNLIIVIFVIYFAINAIKFMQAKTKLDRERNEKINELIKTFNKENNT